MGKGFSGGVGPVSGLLADSKVMNTFKLGDHGSTFGGNPISIAIAAATVEIIIKEGLVENSNQVGSYMLEGM